MSPRASLSEAADRIAKVSGIETVVGRPSTVWSHQRLQRDLPDVRSAVAALERRLHGLDTGPADRPLFIFSAGWRSGSTLLQRLVVSTQRYFIWGEPYHQTDVIRRLAESLIPFGTGWPPREYVYEAEPPAGTPHGNDGQSPDLSALWIANFYPPISRLLEAHRSFLRELLAPPQETTGLEWGLKEVRLSADYGAYLRMLFPQARFIFLVRDPRAAYNSYRDHPTWFERWPRSQIRTPYAYGQVWRRLAESFIGHEKQLDACLIRYEDLIEGGEALERLEHLLEAAIDRSVLENRVSGVADQSRGRPTALELKMLDRATQPVAARLGYPSHAPVS